MARFCKVAEGQDNDREGIGAARGGAKRLEAGEKRGEVSSLEKA